jgi:hypothetical protein
MPTGKSLTTSSTWLLNALQQLENLMASESQLSEAQQSVVTGLKRINASVKQKVKRDIIQWQLVAEAGGCCKRCSQHFHPSIYDFHHVDPREKEFSLDRSNFNRSFDKILLEASKCVLLCANCHRCVHVFQEAKFLKMDFMKPKEMKRKVGF